MTPEPSTSLDLPGGARWRLAPGVAGLLRCGVLVIGGVTAAADGRCAAALAARGEELRDAFAGRAPGGIPLLEEARRLYRSAGVDPTRTRPSSEALLRRALKGQPLPQVNAAVDACNLASLSFLLPIGLYDLDRIEGDVELRLGREGEEYPGIRKGAVHLAGRLGLFDARGPFGSPTSDSERTSVSETAARLLAVIFATAAYPADIMRANVDLLAGLMVRHCGGAVELAAVLPEPQP